MDNILTNVIGLEKEKEELLFIIDCFRRSKELREQGCTIPKGVLLYGAPGNGKTFIIKELIKNIDIPTVVIKGDEENSPKEIIDSFNRAKELGKAIVIIDELDLLLANNHLAVRALQSSIDGVDSSDNMFVICAANDITSIPDAMLRNGRIDRRIYISYPQDNSVLYFKHVAKEVGIILPSTLDEDELRVSLSGLSCVEIKAIVNDIILRNGKDNITEKSINKSIYIISESTFNGSTDDKETNIAVAYHEAGHAVVTSLFPDLFVINTIQANIAKGCIQFVEKKEGRWPFSKCIAQIDICLAGIISEKLLVGEGSRGSESDLHRARNTAYNLFNCAGYSSCWETLPPIDGNSRRESQVKLRKMEEKIEALLQKEEAKTYEIVKEHLNEIKLLGEELVKNKRMKGSAVCAFLNDIRSKDITKSAQKNTQTDVSLTNSEPNSEETPVFNLENATIEEKKYYALKECLKLDGEEKKKLSVSYIQRNFWLGWPSAKEVFDILKEQDK